MVVYTNSQLIILFVIISILSGCNSRQNIGHDPNPVSIELKLKNNDAFEYSLLSNSPSQKDESALNNLQRYTGPEHLGEAIFATGIIVLMATVDSIYNNIRGPYYEISSQIDGIKFDIIINEGFSEVGISDQLLSKIDSKGIECKITAFGNRIGTADGLMILDNNKIIVFQK